MTNYGTHCNDVTSAETVMMIKEHITERYGQIRYTMSDGSSGGAHQQHLHVSNYPGLLQGILPSDGWQDTWTHGTRVRRLRTAQALLRQRTPSGRGPTRSMNRAAHRGTSLEPGLRRAGATPTWRAVTPFYMDPEVGGAGCGTHPNRWSPTNPDGIRCTLQDYNIAVFGPRDATGYAKTPHDNLGIQYGFSALNAGTITVEQFLKLNELIGGYDINGQWQPSAWSPTRAPPRSRMGPDASHTAAAWAKWRSSPTSRFNITEEHYDFRTYVIRNRILAYCGDHDNHVDLAPQG